VQAAFAKTDQPTVLFLPAGEKHKRLRTVESLLEQMAAAGADRDALLVAFGGGVVGDVTGFLAAIYMRGVPFVQFPTTLLAQVDSSVGGKTGVNLAAGKNLVGSFHHPLAVLADADVLTTLPKAELRAGLQESVKAGIIRDAKLFAYLEKNADSVLSGDAKALTHVVAASVRVKADVVANDERESGLRMILNYGHTLGHAIEAATGYKQLLHGEAVGWGSIAATRLGLMRGMIGEAEADRIIRLILRYGPLSSFTATAKKLVALTANDKKSRSGSLSFILPVKIGEVTIVRDVTHGEMTAAAEWMLALMRETTAKKKQA
jgi:3-dehydroquinate synthase